MSATLLATGCRLISLQAGACIWPGAFGLSAGRPLQLLSEMKGRMMASGQRASRLRSAAVPSASVSRPISQMTTSEEVSRYRSCVDRCSRRGCSGRQCGFGQPRRPGQLPAGSASQSSNRERGQGVLIEEAPGGGSGPDGSQLPSDGSICLPFEGVGSNRPRSRPGSSSSTTPALGTSSGVVHLLVMGRSAQPGGSVDGSGRIRCATWPASTGMSCHTGC